MGIRQGLKNCLLHESVKNCADDKRPLQNTSCNSAFPCTWSSQSLTTLADSPLLTPLMGVERGSGEAHSCPGPIRKERSQVCPTRGLAGCRRPTCGNHTHLHLLLRLLAFGGVQGLTRPTGLTLQCLDLLENSSQGLFWGSWLPHEGSGKAKPRDTHSALTWSLVCTSASSCSSDCPGPSFSLTEGCSAAAWASSSATCVDRKFSP